MIEYPDCWTQGEAEQELQENLLDILKDIPAGFTFPQLSEVHYDRHT